MSTYNVIGLMSGSSLDGVDLVYCTLTDGTDKWSYAIHEAECIPYDQQWTERLRSARTLDGRGLMQLDADLGHLYGSMIHSFISRSVRGRQVDLIASHGHTVFHYPELRYTTQIGSGAAIVAETGIQVACDFRTTDVALGGQGTPIVPIGDMLLWPDYDYLLNLGGIANVSMRTERGMIAWDIAVANQVLNYYAALLGLDYDDGGAIAASGRVNTALLQRLDALEYYRRPYPKSLDNGYAAEHILPVIDAADMPVKDMLCTYCAHLSNQLAVSIANAQRLEGMNAGRSDRMLVTGGGAHHQYLIEGLRSQLPMDIVVPDALIVGYKEALVMALMGVLRLTARINVLHSVTGAKRDNIGGTLYMP